MIRTKRTISRKELKKAFIEALVVFLALVYCYPVMIIFINAVKTSNEIAVSPGGLPSVIQFGNFIEAWKITNFSRALLNSVFVTSISLLLIVGTASAAAYPLGRYQTKLNQAMYILFVSLLMVPFQMTMIPLYRLIYSMQWINTFRSVIFIFTSLSVPFSIFLYTGFIKTVPFELEESAIIDGAGSFTIFRAIVFPLLKPVTVSVVILNALTIWNEFLIPLLFLQERSLRTIPLTLFMFQGQYNTNWPMLFSAMVLAMLPMLAVFLILQKYFIKGITAGSVKG